MGLLEPGDITQNCFRVFRFCSNPSHCSSPPARKVPDLDWVEVGGGGSDLAYATDRKQEHHVVTLTSALSEPQLLWDLEGVRGLPLLHSLR